VQQTELLQMKKLLFVAVNLRVVESLAASHPLKEIFNLDI
jgi:hypothetical protein